MSNSTSFQFICPQLISLLDTIFQPSPAGAAATRHFCFAYKLLMSGFSCFTGEYYV